jgi:hypothetical protein
MDISTKAKQAVLEQLIKLMDGKELDTLKSKSPKLGMAKVDIQSTDPKLADELKSKLVGEGTPQEEASESPEDELKEKMTGESDGDDDLERLKELYAHLK